MHYHIIIYGDIQGVGFRYFIQKTALLYGINGWVRNKSDGTVEIDAEGSELNMVQFFNVAAKGNRFSRVESINKERSNDIIGYKSFDIIG